MNNPVRLMAVAVALTVLLAGCASNGEREFGSSVRHMVEGQTYDPAAPKQETGALDAHKAAQAIDAYRAEKKPAAKSTTSILVPTTQ